MAKSTSLLARQVAFAIEVKSAKIFENIFLNNGILAALGANGRVRIRRGGNLFDERVHLGQNSNVGFRSRFTQIPTAFQANWFTASYGQAVISGAAVINLVEQDQAQGEHKLDDIAQKSIDELNNTFPNLVSDALMQTTSGANDPESIRERIEATAFGSQTSSLGGISRAAHVADPDAWQNQHSATAISDVGAASGKAALTKFAWDCSPGGSALNQQPDIGLTTTGVLAKMSGGGDNLRRYSVDGRMLKMGFDNFLVNRAAVFADRNVPAGFLYFLNTNYLRLQVLAGPKTKVHGDVKTIGDGKQSIPLQVRPPIESDDYLNFTVKVYSVMNLTFGGLRQHGLQTSITEA